MRSWGKFWTTVYKKTNLAATPLPPVPPPQTATSEELGAKPGCLPMTLVHSTTKANHLSHTPGRTLDSPTLTPYKEPAHTFSESERGKFFFFLWPMRPREALPEFLMGFLSIPIG